MAPIKQKTTLIDGTELVLTVQQEQTATGFGFYLIGIDIDGVEHIIRTPLTMDLRKISALFSAVATEIEAREAA